VNTYQDWMAFLAKAKDPSKGRPVAKATRIKFHIHGKNSGRLPSVLLTYHDSIIAEWTPTKMYFTNGGYMTRTTKKRLNDYLPSDYYIQQKKGVWYLRNHANTMIRKLKNTFTIKFTHEGERIKD